MMISTYSEDDASVLHDHLDDAIDEDENVLIITHREKGHFKVWVYGKKRKNIGDD